MATGVSLQESYLRGRGSERSSLGIPAVSRNTHQLTNDLFRSKIPLKFEAERLEEHPKPTGVEVEGLETLAGSHEVETLAYKEVIDSHRAPQHMNHIELKVIARRIQIEEPSRLVIRRKPPEEALRIEMLTHTARIDAVALEIFRGRTVSAINVLFEDSSSESTHALSVRTCAESPAMLTKRSHMTALHVVAACTQVTLHTDDSRVIDRLRKIAAIEEYEEWGKWHTVWKLPRLRAMAMAARTTTITIQAMTTMIALSADQWPGKIGCAILWRQGVTSAWKMGIDDEDQRISRPSQYKEEQQQRSMQIEGCVVQEGPYNGYEVWWRQAMSSTAQGFVLVSVYSTYISIILGERAIYDEQ
ncbi:hypothetical protein M404DRAFT_20341 [Pisolithus tinctorius Marx 270]|uniref:Uncharacterized protein n=1 Tax=Pisolithus tinctorius Marx 270 TaxID=870435 RepID=A0A0C3PRL2_PISTI|nr:hypothetical protein M404DRAFT_20341 [Pisolithus tinctorius Marx 270]